MQLLVSSELELKELIELDEASLRELFPAKTTFDNARFNDWMQYFDQINLAR